MPIWPFSLRRRKTMNNNTTTEPLTEKSSNLQSAAGHVPQPSRASSTRRKRRSRQTVNEKSETIEDKDAARPLGKENIEGGFHRKESMDEVTALPVKWKLEHSPHLRPVDSGRAQIPYSFLNNNTASQTSVGRTEGSTSKPGTLRSKRSTMDGAPVRRKSSKKRPNERLREEEIRAMSATMPIPIRTGDDGPFRRDSYNRGTFTGMKKSRVSIPPADDMSSPTVVEQHGWEIGHFWASPRPAVRLSQIPAHTLQGPVEPSMPLAREISERVRDKMPVTRESARRYKTVGAEADVLDSNDLRAVLERDAKRKEQRDRDRQARLDRKLRSIDRSRRNSGRSRHHAEAEKALEAGIIPAVPQRPELDRAQSSVHPALRDEPMFTDDEAVGLGIGQAQSGAERENPFETPAVSPLVEDRQLEQTDPPAETPFDDPVIETAREVRMSSAITPPLSPVEGRRRSSAGLINIEPLPPRATATMPPPPQEPQTRRMGSESKDRRAGAWASFFKRGGTQGEARSPDKPTFANTSRESMSRQQAPLHLVTTRDSAFRRSSTGTPARTMSKFREDLPDVPLSPPDSRVQSPELPTNAVAIAAAAIAAHQATTAQDDTQAGAEASGGARSDTPISPMRGHGAMSASLASVDSEGSWLARAGSTKRASGQSGLSRSYGSLRRRTPDFNASFEDLGGGTGDRDADYLQRAAEGQRRAKARASGSASVGAGIDEVGDMTVHDSVRRKPTLVHRQPAARSREGLLSEFTAEEEASASAIKDDFADDDELVNEATQLHDARSINYAGQHARKVSAGSAKLLDVIPRRMSASPSSPNSPTSRVAEEQYPAIDQTET